MKVKIENKEKFTPIKLTLTFESMEEVGKIYALMNHSSLTDKLQINELSADIRIALKAAVDVKLANSIPYMKWHTIICDLINKKWSN